ncbi:Conjugative transfer protein PilR in PFGI-1-like cluster [Pantoea sp. AS-PWVM4]|uniref:lysylphosphatidylglycerol synthase transmembrane domain-containing protein n=1 Tax=Pantoea sp. AS-PWVM4 TaxID=1332069 RepID=UPI0003AC7CC6|nr:lysylphosphatidylglycerol synthase transmembrane domain-containing protein [Pantoea sp. AS-PWVM4]ERK13862.1 Conjugative transfer protein PilR in PFGI-1-like cluster [Pantoea sp. AS-PWVM4]
MNKFFTRLQGALHERRIIRAIVWFVTIGVMLYLAAVFWSGWQSTVEAFSALGLQTLVISAVLSSSSYLWRFGRWEYSLHCLDNVVPRFTHLGIYMSGLALTATPGKSGETFRSALLVPHGVKVTHSLATFLVDRGSDVLGMILLGMLAAMMAGQSLAWVWLLAFAAILLGSCVFAYALSHPMVSTGWNRLGRAVTWLPIKGGQATLEAWAQVWKPTRVSAFSVVAMVAYGTQALVFAWFCQILGTGISSADCVLIFVQATLFGAASMIPAGLGVMEAALVFQLVAHGVSDGTAMSLAISIRLVTLWFGMSLGALSLLLLSGRDLSSKQSPTRTR